MCGFIFCAQNEIEISQEGFSDSLHKQNWRGPDATGIYVHGVGDFLLGHNRLSILDVDSRSNQPFRSTCGRYLILFNGEIYNYKKVREDLNISTRTESDTEVILQGFLMYGVKILDYIEGMFAFVIFDTKNESWFAARDRFGIKPLYIYEDDNKVIIGSEPSSIKHLGGLSIDEESVEEWKLIRRPCPGFSFFKGLKEFPSASYRKSSELNFKSYWELKPSKDAFSQDAFEILLAESIKNHEISDVSNVSLLSGGLDSAVIAGISRVEKSYCIGLTGNNEFAGAKDSAKVLNKNLVCVERSNDELIESWIYLTKLRGEPLSLPNEGLIYMVCKEMRADEKVVLTGEGADELLFGYDGIYRWSLVEKDFSVERFISKYGYQEEFVKDKYPRLLNFLNNLMQGKNGIEFCEDFFYLVHLPGLLRRMDFASMAASKEARVPFVSRKLIEYVYRKPASIKIDEHHAKKPLRELASKMGLDGALERKKIGFSAQTSAKRSRFSEYEFFQNTVLGALGW